MICPECGEKMKVIDSRDNKNIRWRKVKCLNRSYHAITKETIYNDNWFDWRSLIGKRDGHLIITSKMD